MLAATPDRRRLHPWAVALVCAALTLGGCSATPTASDASRGQLVDALNTSIETRDRAAFDAAFTNDSSAERRDELWANVTQLTLATFTEDEKGLRIEWRVPGDTRSAWHLIDAPTACTAGRCAFTALEPRAGEPSPLWLVEPVQIERGEGWAVIRGEGARSWSKAAEASRAELLAADLAPLSSDWDSELALVAPGTEAGFEAVLGLPASEFASTGALTWVADFGLPKLDGAEPSSTAAAVRIVTNPDTTRALSDDDQRLLITHEGVHVVTMGVGLPAEGRAWVSEGLSEVVALATQPTHVEHFVKRLKDDCDALATPPSDESFSGGIGMDASMAELSYAQAWVLVTQLESKLGREASREEMLRLWHGDDPQLTSVDELGAASVAWCQSVRA